jgi:hypothetical protein
VLSAQNGNKIEEVQSLTLNYSDESESKYVDNHVVVREA